MLLVYLSCAWLAGIFLGSKAGFPPALVPLGLAPLFLLVIRRGRKIIVVVSLSLTALLAGIAYASSLNHTDAFDLAYYNDRGPVSIRGEVLREPEPGESGVELRLEAAQVSTPEGWREVRGRAVIIAPNYSQYHYGDTLLVTGKLETPLSSSDFDYGGYLAHQGVNSLMRYPTIKTEAIGGGAGIIRAVYSLRVRLGMSLASVLPEPQAALARALILGQRVAVPPSLKADFTRSGTAHILAVSGMHIAIVAGLVLALAVQLLGRRFYLHIWLTLLAIWSYSLLTGFNPPVVRGAIMASFFLLAELLGRQRSGIVALSLAAAVMVGVSPYILGDASFQLSFLAMVGLVFFFSPFQKSARQLAERLSERRACLLPVTNLVADSLSATMAAIVAIWPLIAYYFGVVSLVGPLATLLALPVLPGILIVGSLAACAGLAVPILGQVIGWIAWLLLSYLVALVTLCGNLPWAALDTGVTPAFVLGYYLALALAFFMVAHLRSLRRAAERIRPMLTASSNRLARQTRWLVPSLVILAGLTSATAATMPDPHLQVSFLDVGQGDAILIQKASQQVLVDGGPGPQLLEPLGRRMPFWDRTIELLVLTHPHQDHLAGLIEVIRRYKVKEVLCPELDYQPPLYAEFLKLIEEKSIHRIPAQPGQEINLGSGSSITVLNHTIDRSARDSELDKNSLILRLASGGASFLLTGDAMPDSQLEMVERRAELSSTVLKVPHHGSASADYSGFTNAVAPQVAVISVGAGNRFGHPDAQVIDRLNQRGSRVYRTDLDGTVDITIDGERLSVRMDRE